MCAHLFSSFMRLQAGFTPAWINYSPFSWIYGLTPKKLFGGGADLAVPASPGLVKEGIQSIPILYNLSNLKVHRPENGRL
jgi:hypothetical protein